MVPDLYHLSVLTSNHSTVFSPSKIQGIMILVEPVATSKLNMDPPHSYIKGNPVLKACWANMPYVCWGEQYNRGNIVHCDHRLGLSHHWDHNSASPQFLIHTTS